MSPLESIAFHAKRANRLSWPYFAMVVLWIAAIVQILYFYSQLPPLVASHFNAAGKANGWMDKETFVKFYLGLMTFLSGLFLAISAIIGGVPVSLWNLPNKEYWLSDVRRGETVRFVKTRLAMVGVMVQILILAIFQACLNANANRSYSLGQTLPWVLIGTFLLFMLWWMVGFIRRFSRMP